MNEQINERLKSAVSGAIQPALASVPVYSSGAEQPNVPDESDDKIFTTLEELEGYHIVRAVVRSVVDAKRIVQRDTQGYFGILLDDNNRKPIADSTSIAPKNTSEFSTRRKMKPGIR